MVDPEVLAGVIRHVASKPAGELHIELWQVINLAGTVALAGLLLPPVVQDLKRWRNGS